MVTEFVEIVVRERGTRQAQRGIRGIGSAAATAAAAAGGLLAALGAIAAIRGFTGLIASSVQVSAEFEQLEVRLRTLLGSQSEANRALENFTELASRTPFAVRGIVEGASTLAAAALGNRERLEELTQTAANLAASTGISFQEASGNLQRALSAGIGAADLFRDRGVRALIESINGIPDLTKVPLQELEQLFLDTFGAGGLFGTAAEDLSRTLGGALSNIGDAATNLQDAIGDVFSPAVIAVAREVIIPSLEQLEKLVRDNEKEFRDLAGNGLKFAGQAFIALARAALRAVELLDQGRQLVIGLRQGLLQLRLVGLQQAGPDPFDTGQQAARIAQVRQEIADLEQAGVRGAMGVLELQTQLAKLNETFDDIERRINDVDLTNLPDEPEVPRVPLPTGDPAASEAAERAAALERIAGLTDRLRIAALRRVEPLDAQLERLRQQRAELEEQARLAGDVNAAAEALGLIDNQVRETEQQKADLLREQEEEQERIAQLAAEIAQFNPALAEDLLRAAENALATGEGLEDVVRQLRRIREEGTEQIQRERETAATLGNNLRREVTRGLSDALVSSAQGEGVNWAQTLGDLASRFLSRALESVLDGFLSQLQEGLRGATSGAGSGGGLGGALTGLIGLGGTLAAAALQDSDTSIRRAAIDSGVTETRQTRGVVAGPTNIPIFQVGDSIEEAFTGTNSLLEVMIGLSRQELAALRGILAAVQGGLDPGAQLTTSSPTIG